MGLGTIYDATTVNKGGQIKLKVRDAYARLTCAQFNKNTNLH